MATLKQTENWLSKKSKKDGKDQETTNYQDQLSHNAGQGEHSTILLTFIKLPFVIKIFVLFIFVWPFNTCFTVV